ncbi:inorganic anion transporter, SulP family protein [Verrucomicrobiia bacterium DG1235]|nr:inorganic anion transporter, SulP family protein [Verrucomicrobiae bacterium DG1235]
MLPLTNFLRNYKARNLRQDIKAGFNVALLDFPQGMAYAMIAGLPVNFGIYSSALGSISGALFGSSRFLMLGPTNASAVLLLSGFLSLNLSDEQRIIAMPLLLLMVAAIMILGAFLRVHTIIRYVSRSVITGYVTAAALLIIVNQFKHSLGIITPRAPTFLENAILLWQNLTSIDLHTAALSLSTIAIALATKRWLKALPNIAITLALTSAIAVGLQSQGILFAHLPAVPIGTWPLSIPTADFHLFDELLGVAAAIAFLSLLESASIAKNLAAQAGDRVDIKQQMISMGIADAANAFGSGMPVSGSLTRSTLNYESGAHSPVSSLTSGLILVCGALLLGPAIGYIPKASLASLVILVGISLIKIENIKTFIGATKSDAATFIATLLTGLLFPLDIAIYVGVIVSIILFLQKVSAPQLVEYSFNDRGELAESQRKEDDEQPAISIMHVEGDLFFGSTDVFDAQLRELSQEPNVRLIILRLKNAHNLDASAALAIKEFAAQATKRKVKVLVSGAMPPVFNILKKVGIADVIGIENIFQYTPENVTLSTRNALKRAQEILGVSSAEILLFGKQKKGADDLPSS